MALPKKTEPTRTSTITTSVLFQEKAEDIIDKTEKNIPVQNKEMKAEIENRETEKKHNVKREDRYKTGKYVDRFSFTFPQEERDELKAWCMLNGLTLNDYVINAVFFLKNEIEAGNVKISKFGVKKLNQN